MKKLRLILMVVACCAAMASCSSHRHVARGEQQQRLEAAIQAAIDAEKPKPDNLAKAVLAEAQQWKGTPYKYGGHSRSGTDCSGFVMEVYLKAAGIKLPRSTAEMSQFCYNVKKKDLQPGDLVFFHGTKKGKVNHVGIYMGDGKMIHASSSKGVRIDDLETQYYIEHFTHGARVPIKD